MLRVLQPPGTVNCMPVLLQNGLDSPTQSVASIREEGEAAGVTRSFGVELMQAHSSSRI